YGNSLLLSDASFAAAPSTVVTAARVEARKLTVFTPGATTVGWNSGLPNSPREEKLARRPRLSVALVLMTHGATEYGFNESVPGPVLPAEKTTLTPLSVSILVAMFTGSLTSKTVFAEKLQLTTRTLKAAAFANK